MSSLVSIAGIDQAIAALALTPETQKAKLIAAVRSWFSVPDDLQKVTEISSEALVAAIWGDEDDPAASKARRKSLSSLKSALNKSLKDLAAQGLNQEGLIIGRSNVFEVSEEQTKALLEQLGVGGGDSHLAETIAAFRKAFPEISGAPGGEGLSGLLHELEQARDHITQLQDALREKEGEISTLQQKISLFSPTSAAAKPGSGHGNLEAEEVEGGKAGRLDDGALDGNGSAGDTDSQILEEAEFEEIAVEDTDLLPEAEGPAGLEADAMDGNGSAGDTDSQVLDEAEFEEVEVEDTDLLPKAEGPAGPEAGTLDGNGSAGDADSQVLEEGEFEEIEVENTDLLPEAAGPAGLEDGAMDGNGSAGDTDSQVLEEGEFEEIAVEDTDLLPEAAGPAGLEAGSIDGNGSAGDTDNQVLEEGEFEDVAIADDNAASLPQSKLLEVLSKYLEPEDVLPGTEGTLIESEEGLVSQLLERFTPKFIKIPADNYRFGRQGPSTDEHLLQMVMLKEFYLGQYPVTNDLFELFVRETGYQTDAEKCGHGLVHEGQWRSSRDPNTGLASFAISQATSARQTAGANWRHPAGPGCLLDQRHNHPVVQVSHRDAQAFAAWAGKRLPTEAEWEVAARGREGTLFPWGDTWEAGRGNFSSSCLGDTTPVEHYFDQGHSPFGIGDLLGNVYEWTSTAEHSLTHRHLILKGGSWHSRGIVSACHRKIAIDTWSNIIGFRLAVSG